MKRKYNRKIGSRINTVEPLYWYHRWDRGKWSDWRGGPRGVKIPSEYVDRDSVVPLGEVVLLKGWSGSEVPYLHSACLFIAPESRIVGQITMLIKSQTTLEQSSILQRHLCFVYAISIGAMYCIVLGDVDSHITFILYTGRAFTTFSP